MLALFANNFQTTLATSISSSQTSIALSSTTGLPTPSSGQYIVMTFTAGTTNEIVWVTAISGSNITVLRGQEGTTASSFSAGSYASCFPTAGTMRALTQVDQIQTNYYTYTDAGGTANALTGSVPSDLTTLSDGMMIIVNAAYANTGAATFNLTLGSTITGALPIVMGGNTPLTAGIIPAAGTQILLIYDADFNSWVIANPNVSLAAYAPLASPAFTGTPTAPTATTGTNTTQLATTAFVQNTAANYAPLFSPTLAGTPTAPTASVGTNTTQLATTAFVSGSFAPINSPDFVGTPTAPTASAGTNTAQLATTAFVQSAIGLFANVTFPSRALNTTYTNSTGKPMFVSITVGAGGGGFTPSFLINGITAQNWVNANTYSGGAIDNVVFAVIVPVGATYQLKNTSGSPTINTWAEIY